MTSHSLRLAPRFLFVLVAAIAVLFGTAQTQLQAATATRTFDPVAFFKGDTEGHGTLKKTMSAKQTTHVTGTGKVQGGQLLIDQTVRISGEPTKTRHWQLSETKTGSYSGTISDAKGAVTAWVDGSKLHIKYTMKDGGMSVSQVLTMAEDGRSVHNAMKIRKFGIVVATIDETIRKV
jgi:hypothetical protein